MNIRLKALARAQRYIGTSENPPGSNSGLLINRWLRIARAGTPNPWCAAFDYAMKIEVGSDAVKLIQFPAAVRSWVDAAFKYGWVVLRPFRGDDVAYSWHGPDPHPDDHIGIVERVLSLPKFDRPLSFRGKWWIRTVEGNTGDKVRRRWRWVDPSTVVFIRVPD